MITVYGGDWSRKLCNGCYGRLLSLFEIKAGIIPDDQRVEALVGTLLATVALDDQRQAERILKASEKRAQELSPEAVRFIATAEHIAGQLQDEPQLEWSPAVIGLCKGVEAEVVSRMLRPLAVLASHEELNDDRSDKDFGRIAAFCEDPNRKPPELGAFAHFLQTFINSHRRRETSVLLGAFRRLAAGWTGSTWILSLDGLHAALASLTTDFRNRAAHIDELGRADYIQCRELTIGSEGILWKLVLATKPHR
ncbi:MAG: hypothetical protein IMZ57_01075 [Acidobacteria bacterium]|nr:hypothetical protein [Acidobacteriota bacterium]